MAHRLYLNLIWHMHQPYYFDTTRDIFIFPWVRTHATKDYLYMARLAERFPSVKMTINFAPSLLTQIDLYSRGKIDRVWFHFEKPPGSLTVEEKEFIIKNFFLAASVVQTRRFPYFEELRKSADQHTQSFTTQDWLDLQVLYQLLWFDPITIESYPELKALIERGRGFGEKDKEIIKDVTHRSIDQIIPTYRKLAEKGQIEISATPFYHPIVPLLIDNWVAEESKSGTLLPDHRFQYPEDAGAQIEKAKEYSQAVWGKEIQGMWPSEGSVSAATAQCFAEHGLSWMATGEEVLFRTLGISLERNQDGFLYEGEKLYHPWLFSRDGKRITVFFRDRFLSDLIGFAYQHFSAPDAIKDLIGRLNELRRSLPDDDPIVTIILDGENAWEYYANNGFEFLNGLYDALSQQSEIVTTTPSRYLLNHTQNPILDYLVPGSWIYGFLNTWIGHPDKHWAWDQLFLVRQLLAKKEKDLDEEQKKEVFNILYQAEGSDWFWWLGTDNPSIQKRDFQNQFVSLLQKICGLIGEEYPREVKRCLKMK